MSRIFQDNILFDNSNKKLATTEGSTLNIFFDFVYKRMNNSVDCSTERGKRFKIIVIRVKKKSLNFFTL